MKLLIIVFTILFFSCHSSKPTKNYNPESVKTLLETKYNDTPIDLKDGAYEAYWTGYTLEIVVPDKPRLSVKLNQGIRGMNVKVVIGIMNGYIFKIIQ